MRAKLPDGLHMERSDRLLIPIIASVSALASLALGCWDASYRLSREWETGTSRQVTIEIPNLTGNAIATAEQLALVLRADPDLENVTIVPEKEVRALLRPWLGSDQTVLNDLPVVLSLTRKQSELATNLPVILDTLAPEAIIEENEHWSERLSLLGRSLQACAWLAVLLAGFATAGVTTLSVRITLVARRRTIEILHSFGASDGLIARRIAMRSAELGLTGAVIGAVLGSTTLAMLHHLIVPFLDHATGPDSLYPETTHDWLTSLTTQPASLFQSLACVPMLVSILSFCVSLGTVHMWLRKLP